ncbi:hypothetical protein ACIHCM_10575 [Streptomyces sp. NPDC052023]|uniref:hypothetical protein n=1 Tax=Streptomyces sp. NPDC052023 TaxID=3365681 RepID=UPI0037D46B7F
MAAGQLAHLAMPSSPRSGTTSVAPEKRAQIGPLLVAAHEDDPFRTELFGRQHREQADSAVTDDGDGVTGTHADLVGGVVAVGASDRQAAAKVWPRRGRGPHARR